MGHPWDGILLRSKKGVSNGLSQIEAARLRRPHPVRFHLEGILERQIHVDKRQTRGCQGLGVRGGGLTAKEHGKTWGGDSVVDTELSTKKGEFYCM